MYSLTLHLKQHPAGGSLNFNSSFHQSRISLLPPNSQPSPLYPSFILYFERIRTFRIERFTSNGYFESYFAAWTFKRLMTVEVKRGTFRPRVISFFFFPSFLLPFLCLCSYALDEYPVYPELYEFHPPSLSVSLISFLFFIFLSFSLFFALYSPTRNCAPSRSKDILFADRCGEDTRKDWTWLMSDCRLDQWEKSYRVPWLEAIALLAVA